MVEEQREVTRLQMRLQGQEGNLTDQQTEQIREQVWQMYVQNQMVKHECDKLGLFVTDGEVQEALRQGTAQSLQLMAGIFGNQKTGRFDLAQLQAFLKDYNKTIQQAHQAQHGEPEPPTRTSATNSAPTNTTCSSPWDSCRTPSPHKPTSTHATT